VGPPLALVLPLSIAIFESPGSALVVAILVTALSTVVVNVVGPRVMSSAIGLHPLLVFVGLLAGGKLAGLWGAVFGVPAVAVISAMAVFYHALIEGRRTRGASSLSPEAPPPVHAHIPLVDDLGPTPGTAPLDTPSENVPRSAPIRSTPRASARR
jgi:hypothetical protein